MTIDYTVLGFYFSILAIVLTIIVPFFYVQYTIKTQYRHDYNAALNKMLEEMQNNFRKMHNFNNDLTEASNLWNDRSHLTEVWLHKSPSFGLHRFILHYLPSKAYYNFMNQGYFLKIEDGRLEHLMEFYVRCIHFSENTTPIEAAINRLDKNSDAFEQNLNALIQQINNQYALAMNGFDYHYEGEHGFNPQNREGLEIRHWYNV